MILSYYKLIKIWIKRIKPNVDTINFWEKSRTTRIFIFFLFKNRTSNWGKFGTSFKIEHLLNILQKHSLPLLLTKEKWKYFLAHLPTSKYLQTFYSFLLEARNNPNIHHRWRGEHIVLQACNGILLNWKSTDAYDCMSILKALLRKHRLKGLFTT